MVPVTLGETVAAVGCTVVVCTDAVAGPGPVTEPVTWTEAGRADEVDTPTWT